MKFKLKHKILLLYAGVSVCLLILIGGFLSSKLEREKFKAIHNDFEKQLAHIDFALTSFLADVGADLETIVSNEYVRSRNDENFTNFTEAEVDTFQYNIGRPEQEIIKIFNSYRITHKFANSVYMGRENGSFVRSHKRNKPTKYDPRTRPWYILAKENPGKVVRTTPYTSVTSLDVNIGIVTALLDKQGQVYGVVGIDITIDNLTDYIENIQVGRNGYMVLLDEEGIFLASPNKAERFQSIEAIYKDDFERLFKENQGFVTLTTNSERKYLFFDTSPELGWNLGMIIPVKAINSEVRSFVNGILLILILTLVLLSALTLIGLQSFVIKPLKKLTEGTDVIARTGNLDHRIEIRSRDEMGELAQSFNEMMRSMNKARTALKESEEEVRKHRDHLEERVEERTIELSAEIAERKRTEEALRESEAEYRLLVDNMPGIVYKGTADWSVDFIDDKIQTLIGYRVEEFNSRERKWSDLIVEKDLPAMREAFVEALKTDKSFIREYRVETAGGETIWLSDRGTIVCNEKGEIEYISGVFFDVTERKEAEEELRKLSRGIEQSPASVVITDREGDIEYVNPKFVEVTGYRANEAIGQNPRILKSGKQPPEYYKKLWDTILSGGEWRGEFQNKKKSGEIYWEYASISPIRNAEGEITHFVAVKEDITERKRMEEELIEAKIAADEANKAKGDFLANMSHELRTPLNGVLGYAQILQRDPAMSKRQRESLHAIESCGQHLLNLINDVLDLSKIEAGRLEVDLAPCDLHRLLKSVSDIISQRTEEKGLAFSTDVSPEVPQGIITDATKLRQVLVNLLGNSVKFTTEGSISLSVQESEDKRLEFAVNDTGIGMTPEELAKVFDPFTQAEGGKVSGGTGLGLAISQRIVNALDGKLDVTSEHGKGTSFTISHPLVEVDDLDVKELAEEPLTEEREYVLAPGQDITLLVADDRKINRDILVQLLEGAGFQTMEAVDGKEALEKLQKHRIPLVLMDVRMPVINGIEATRQIRSDPALKDTVVIAVSASVFPDFQDKIREVGCDDFIGKPFRTSEVFNKLERHLQVQYVEQEKEEPRELAEDELPPLPSEVAKDIAKRLRKAVELGDITELNKIASELEARQDVSSGYGEELSRLTIAFDFDTISQLADVLEKDAND